MTTNLVIGYPDIPRRATELRTSHTFGDFTPVYNLMGGRRANIAQLASGTGQALYINFDLSSSVTASSNFCYLARADFLRDYGVSGSDRCNQFVLRGGSQSPFVPSSISGLVAHFDSTRGVTAASDGRVSAWADLSTSAISATQSTTVNKPFISRSDTKGNWVEYSEAFTNAWWTKTNITAADNNTTNPLTGTTTAAKLTCSGAGNILHRLQLTSTSRPTLWATLTHRFSVYLKYSNYQYVWFGHDGPSYTGVVVDIQNGTINSTAGTVSSSIESVGSGWYRVTYTATAGASDGAWAPYIAFSDNSSASSGPATFVAAGTEELYIFGAQLNFSADSATYLATSGGPAYAGVNGNKAIMFPYIDATGTFLDCGTPSALTITGDISIFAVVKRLGTDTAAAQNVFHMKNGSTDGYLLQLTNSSTWPGFFETASGSNSNLTATTGTTQNTAHVINLLRASGTATHYLDTATNGSGAVSNPATATNPGRIGGQGASNNFKGYICELLFYNVALGTTDRQAIENYLTTKWKTSAPVNEGDVQTTTFYGPRATDYITDFSASTAYRHWWAQYDVPNGSTTKYPHSKLYFGTWHDMGKDPDSYTIERLPAKDASWVSGSGAMHLARIEEPIYRIELIWEGISDDVTRDFYNNIERFKHRDTYILYTRTDHTLLDNTRVLHVRLVSADTQNSKVDWNRIATVWEEVLG